MELLKEKEEEKQNKILAAFCYFSVLFFGLIFPLIVYFITDESFTKEHAKKAFLSHLIPYIVLIGFVFISFTSAVLIPTDSTDAAFATFGFGFVFTYVVVLCICLAVTIWNIVKGVKVLK